MASPPSGAENGAASKIAKDRSCPFCGQAFTSSSLGRHLDLYIKPKNPKPADGIHDVDEIRKLRGSITRRQSRIASVKRDTSTPSGPASARYSLEENSTTPAVRINEPSWEATGVMNDLPPRIEPRPTSARDLGKKEQLKADLTQRQKLTEELDIGRAAQLALKELIGTIRDAETSATGKDLYDFDFFQSSFATLVIRILSPPPPLASSSPLNQHQYWSLGIPGEEQREAILRDLETRIRVAQQRSVWKITNEKFNEQYFDKFYRHISHTFESWRSLSESNRNDVWQREILKGYVRLDVDLKDAYNTIQSLKREIEHLSGRLDKLHSRSSLYPNSWQERYNNPYAPLTTFRLSDDLLRQLCKQGLDLQDWDYERLVDKWKTVVKNERVAVNGLEAQRSLSTSSQYTRRADVGRAPESSGSRSPSVVSAMSAAPPTRTSSLDTASQEADAEGEEDELTTDAYRQAKRMVDIQPSSQAATGKSAGGGSTQSRDVPLNMSIPGPRLSNAASSGPSLIDTSFRWSQTQSQAPATTSTTHIEPRPCVSPRKKLPPGPNSWLAEFHQAATHSMEGVEGPAAGATALR